MMQPQVTFVLSCAESASARVYGVVVLGCGGCVMCCVMRCGMLWGNAWIRDAKWSCTGVCFVIACAVCYRGCLVCCVLLCVLHA